MTWEDHEAYARDLDDWARGHREELPEDVRHERLLRESEGAGPSPPGAGPGPVPSGPAASGADGSAPPPPAGDQPPPPGPKEANTPELRKKWLGGGDEPPSIRNLTPQEQANLTPLQYQEFLQDALNWARSHPGKEPEGWPEALLMPPSPRSGPTPDDPEHPRPPDGGPR